MKHRGKAVLAKNWVKQDSLDAQEIIIEYCCGQNSAIGKYTTSSLVVRFTAEDDLTKKETLATVKAVAEANPKASVLLWVAIPCTGGSPLQHINHARGMDPDRLRAHWKLFRKLWSGFEKVGQRIQSLGGQIVIEWPHRCQYWNDPRVAAYIRRNAFVKFKIDGCMYDMKPFKTNPSIPNGRVHKVWIMATSDEKLGNYLEASCDHQHHHVPISGVNTKPTDNYPVRMVRRIHQF